MGDFFSFYNEQTNMGNNGEYLDETVTTLGESYYYALNSSYTGGDPDNDNSEDDSTTTSYTYTYSYTGNESDDENPEAGQISGGMTGDPTIDPNDPTGDDHNYAGNTDEDTTNSYSYSYEYSYGYTYTNYNTVHINNTDFSSYMFTYDFETETAINVYNYINRNVDNKIRNNDGLVILQDQTNKTCYIIKRRPNPQRIDNAIINYFWPFLERFSYPHPETTAEEYRNRVGVGEDDNDNSKDIKFLSNKLLSSVSEDSPEEMYRLDHGNNWFEERDFTAKYFNWLETEEGAIPKNTVLTSEQAANINHELYNDNIQYHTGDTISTTDSMAYNYKVIAKYRDTTQDSAVVKFAPINEFDNNSNLKVYVDWLSYCNELTFVEQYYSKQKELYDYTCSSILAFFRYYDWFRNRFDINNENCREVYQPYFHHYRNIVTYLVDNVFCNFGWYIAYKDIYSLSDLQQQVIDRPSTYHWSQSEIKKYQNKLNTSLVNIISQLSETPIEFDKNDFVHFASDNCTYYHENGAVVVLGTDNYLDSKYITTPNTYAQGLGIRDKYHKYTTQYASWSSLN